MAVQLTGEARARTDGDTESAETAADAARAFLPDHLGMWIAGWAARVAKIDELEPWAPVAAATAALVRAECHDRHVIPSPTPPSPARELAAS